MKEQILHFALEHYDSLPEYLWKEHPSFAIMRHKSNRKWYAAIMELSPATLDLSGETPITVINLKCSPMLIGSLLRQPGFHPAYHMNKEHWITLRLDGSVPMDKIYFLLDLSFHLTAPKRKRGEKL